MTTTSFPMSAVGGGGGGGRGTGSGMIIDPRSVPAAICQGRCCSAGGKGTWNGLNFKQLGKVRVKIFENIFAIVVPVDLSSYVFGGGVDQLG
jgi:hypothetical protein